MTAYIGYNNIFETGTVTVTSEATGYEKENAYDWLSGDWWQASAAGTVYITVDMGSATTVDYWALAFHDMADNSATIKPQYSSGSTSPFNWSDLDTVQTPSANNEMIFRPVTSVNVRYYRFEITSTGNASFIGAVAMGQSLTLQRPLMSPFVTPYHGRNKKIMNSITEGGNFVGKSVYRNGYQFEIDQRNVTPAWVSSNWEALADHVEIKPFFFLYDYEDAPTEVAFCWTNGINNPTYNADAYMDFSLDCGALI